MHQRDVFISDDAPASLVNDLEKLKRKGIIKGRICVYARGHEEIDQSSQEEKFSTKNIFSLLCFGSSQAVKIVESGQSITSRDEDEIRGALESKEKGVVDLLGAYFADERKIELYIQKIEYCAKQFRCPFINLYKVVKVHEICHAVQHLGLDQRGDCIEQQRFHKIPAEIIEPLAEYWTWIVLSRLGSDGAIDAFFELDKHHPKIYRKWCKLVNCHPESIRLNWVKLRLSDRNNLKFNELESR